MMDCYTVIGFWVGVIGLFVGVAGLVFSIIVYIKAGNIEDALIKKVNQQTTFEYLQIELRKLEEICEYYRDSDSKYYLSMGTDDLIEIISMLDALKPQLSQDIHNEIESIRKVSTPTKYEEYKPYIGAVKPHLFKLVSLIRIEVSKYEKR